MNSIRQRNEAGESERPLLGDWVDAAARQAGKAAVRAHHLDGRSVPVDLNGGVGYLNPDGTVTPDDRSEYFTPLFPDAA